MFLKLAKLFYLIFVLYIVWFQQVFSSIPNVPLILGLAMFSFLLLHKMRAQKNLFFLITKPVLLWLLFSIYILFIGYLVAENKVLLISSVLTYIQTLALIIFIIDVSKHDKSNVFFIKSYLIIAIFYAVSLILWGYDNGGGTVTLSPTSNPNADGLMLLYGIFCIIILIDFRKSSTRLIMSFMIIFLFFYGIVLTSSRKSFIGAVLMLILWILFTVKDYWKFSSIRNRIVFSMLTISTLIITYLKFIPFYLESNMYARLTEEGATGGDQIRISMYNEALDFFKSNPFFGIGFNQYRDLSIWQTYSHSTYAEIISTTGILGTMLYFIPYLIIIIKLLLMSFHKKYSSISNKANIYLILMMVMLSLGTGVIHFYGIRDSVMLAIMISFIYSQKINTDLSNKEEVLKL